MSSSESEYENETIIKDDFSDFEDNEIFKPTSELPTSTVLDLPVSDSETNESNVSEIDVLELENTESLYLKDDSKLTIEKEKNKIESTPKYLFKFEYVKIISKRVAEIRNIKKVDFLEAQRLAKQELKEGKLNYTIKRTLPDGTFDYYKVNDLYIKK